MKKYPLYPNTLVPTLKELIAFCAEKYSNRPAFQYTDRKSDVVVDYSQFQLYCGHSSHCLVPAGDGITAGLLNNNGIDVFGESELDQLIEILQDDYLRQDFYTYNIMKAFAGSIL